MSNMIQMPRELTDEQADAAMRATAVHLDIKGSQLTLNREKMKARYIESAPVSTTAQLHAGGDPAETSDYAGAGANLAQRVKRLEDFCRDFFTMTYQSTERKANESRIRIARIKANMRESVRKRSLRKRKPIRRKRVARS
jgi:hypothetical protein